jgi:hypothetical protein
MLISVFGALFKALNSKFFKKFMGMRKINAL